MGFVLSLVSQRRGFVLSIVGERNFVSFSFFLNKYPSVNFGQTYIILKNYKNKLKIKMIFKLVYYNYVHIYNSNIIITRGGID